MSSLRFTNIQHDFRKKFNLTCNEYVLADMIYFLSTNPDSLVLGWAYKSRHKMAEDIGVSKQSILNLIKVLEDKGIIIKDPETSFLKTTKRWNEVYFTEGKESLPTTTGKESLPHDGKESLPYNYNLDNNIVYTKSFEKKDSVPIKTEIKPLKAKKEKKEPGAYQFIVDFWLKEFHTDFTFGSQTGSKVKSLIKKITHVLNHYNQDPTDERIADFFKTMCLKLPLYYKDKDLSIIDSKFNEIFTEVKNSKNGQPRTSPGQQSIFRTP